MKKPFADILVGILLIIPIAYLIYIYPALPAIVPTHFGIDGKPNGFSHKPAMIWIIGLTDLVSGGAYLLIKHLPGIDPKKTAGIANAKLRNIAIAVVALLSAVMISILYSSVHGIFSFNYLLNPLLGIFFIFTGNLMYNIKPNYFVGVRVPWTLENEDNWRATHHLTGILWVIGGLLITAFSLFLSERNGSYFLMTITALMAAIPILYSFLYFRKHRRELNG